MSITNMRQLIISILLSVGVGTVSALLTMNSIDVYNELQKPALSPPGWIFSVVWTILYILMGISAYLIYISDSPDKYKALKIYIAQLIVNALWSVIFFNLECYLFSFIWLILLLILVILMVKSFSAINKTAGYLQIPYLLWLIFAGYLNLSIYLLNR